MDNNDFHSFETGEYTKVAKLTNDELYENSKSITYYAKDGNAYYPVTIERTDLLLYYRYDYLYNGKKDSYTVSWTPPRTTLYTRTITRRQALQDAANAFVANNATENGIDHRIAVVGFADSSPSYNNTVLKCKGRIKHCTSIY